MDDISVFVPKGTDTLRRYYLFVFSCKCKMQNFCSRVMVGLLNEISQLKGRGGGSKVRCHMAGDHVSSERGSRWWRDFVAQNYCGGETPTVGGTLGCGNKSRTRR